MIEARQGLGVRRPELVCAEPDQQPPGAGDVMRVWGLKGGGGGSLGVVTRVTLKTHPLPALFGAAFGAVKAVSDAAFRRLIERFVAFYRDSLFNPHWGETVSFRRDNVLEIGMVFQDLDQARAAAVWAPFFAWR